MRKLVICLVGAAIVALVPFPAFAATKPNFVFVLTDDQAFNTLQKMPNVRRLANRGMEFRRAFVTNSLCCPSRATILTGMSSGHTGVWTNGDEGIRWGGWPAFRRNARKHDGSLFGNGNNEARTIAFYLHNAGYRTGLFGKYLNHYEMRDGSTPPIPQGWSSWHSFIGSNGSYYDYRTSDQGKRHHFGSRPRDYSTNVFGREAGRFLHSPGIQDGTHPFFLYYAPYAPHGPVTPAPKFSDVRAPIRFESRAYNERHVADKPSYIRRTHLLDAHDHSRLGSAWDRSYGTLRSVDQWVGRFQRALPRRVRRHTVFIFTSDHGAEWGDHRLTYKEYPYERSIRVPLIFAGPGIIHRSTAAIAGNADLAPTILGIARLNGVGGPFDGRSLKPVLTGTAGSVRKAVLLEHLTTKYAPSYCGLRTGKWKFVVYRDGFKELYNMQRDQYELTNVAHRRPEIRRRMHRHTMHLCLPRPPDW